MSPPFDPEKARDLLKAYAPGFARPCEIEALAASLDEIERLQKVISEPVDSFGTPELITWAEGLQKIISDFPEGERGQIPFALTMGDHLEKFAKSWNSSVMQEQAKRIVELEGWLVEETAWSEYNAETQGIRQDPPYQDVAARYEQAAREQLRQTGKL
jgi:hypothetical protein